MAELTTYLFPAVQALFYLIIGIVWLVGFIRQRNAGFLLLMLASLAEALTTLARQGIINYVIYHEPHLSAVEKSSTLGMISMTILSIYIVYWLATILGGLLIVFHRSKYETKAVATPPVSC
jgi:hypothetical protein